MNDASIWHSIPVAPSSASAPEDRAVHDRDAVPDRGVVHEVAGREVVRTVDDHVPAVGEDPLDVLRGEPLLERHHPHVRVERLDGALRGEHLRLAEAVGRVDDLALQVGLVDDVRVHDPERADARGREVERGRRAESARADEEDARVEDALLAVLADLGDEQVPAVARALLRGEDARDRDLEAVPLPVAEPASEVDDALVAELAQGLRSERGAGARRAVDDERPRLVGDEALDALLEPAAARVQGARDVPLLPLVRLADVDEERRVGAAEELVRVDGGDLVDLGAHAPEELPVAGHYFPNYSEGPTATVAA